ncbi:MAG TPA: 2-dehydropantoate 2-reductase [Candidatus Angelobacter sp.]
MRTLVVGAGAIGGYFGGRLLEARLDVTFLVRPRRAAELSRSGLIIRSRSGDVTIPQAPMVLAENLRESFDLVLLSSKAFDLESAMVSFAPAVGPSTVILPLLNGMRHLDVLEARFGAARVLGGQCLIAATVNEKGEIIHLNENHDLSFGERDGSMSERVRTIAGLMQTARFNVRASAEIIHEMWAKWVFIAAAAGATCLMRASVGDIVASPGGTEFMLALLQECRSVAASHNYPPREASVQRSRDMLTAKGSGLTASMLRDIERNAAIEADHIIGDMIQRGPGADLPLLKIAYAHLKAYENRRQRILSAAQADAAPHQR